MLQLNLLGSTGIVGADPARASALLSQPKRVALLAYLLLASPRGYQRRDTLLALFWPEADDARARHALNQALYQIRRCLGTEVLLSRGDAEVGLDLQRVGCDALLLLEAPAEARAADLLQRYRGELLPGFHTDASPEFDQWLSDRRDAVRRAALALALQLAAEAEAHGDVEGTGLVLRRASEIAPLDEQVVQRLMRACDRCGNRGEALTVYEAFAARLMKELEVAPSPETTALFVRIRERVDSDAAVRQPTLLLPRSEPQQHEQPQHEPPPHEPPPQQPQRRRWITPPRRRTVLAAVVILLGVSIPLARAAREDGPRRIVVAPLVNGTGDPSLDAVGGLTADWITEGLTSRSSHVFVDPLTGIAAASVIAPGTRTNWREWARLMALETRADIVVGGTYYVVGDSLVFHARISDAAGKVLRSIPAVATHRSTPGGAAAMLHSRIGGALAGLLDATLLAYDGELAPPSYEAYQAYVDGTVKSVSGGSSPLAAERFARAYRSDTTFKRALLRLAIEEARRGDRTPDQRMQAFDTLAGHLLRARGSLSVADRHHLDALIAERHLRYQEAYQAHRLRAEAAPGSDAAALDVALAASRVNRPLEAVARLRALGDRRGLVRLWPGYNGFFTDNLHRLGEHQEEWDVTERDTATTARDLNIDRRLRALAAMGRVTMLRDVVDRYRSLPASAQGIGNPFTSYWAISREPGALMLAAQELRSHGHAAAAEPFLAEAIAWYAAQPDSATSARGFRMGWARALVMAGRWKDAEAVLARAHDNLGEWGLSRVVSPTEYYRGIVQARQGRPALAQTLVHRIGSEAPRIGTAYLQAVLYAAIGDEDAAFGYLNEQFRRGFLNWRPIHDDPVLEPLLRKPRFRALVAPKG